MKFCCFLGLFVEFVWRVEERHVMDGLHFLYSGDALFRVNIVYLSQLKSERIFKWKNP